MSRLYREVTRRIRRRWLDVGFGIPVLVIESGHIRWLEPGDMDIVVENAGITVTVR